MTRHELNRAQAIYNQLDQWAATKDRYEKSTLHLTPGGIVLGPVRPGDHIDIRNLILQEINLKIDSLRGELVQMGINDHG